MAKGNEGKYRISDAITSTQTLKSVPLLPTLSFDLVTEILCRLPVKLLLQLQCLCKSFKHLISDRKFAKKHLCMPTKRYHLMVYSANNSGDFVLYDSSILSVLSGSTITQTQLIYPNSLGYGYILSLCSCDGILCLTIFNRSSPILWNPSTRKSKILPPLTYIQRDYTFCSFSFGYDHFIDNYKIIGICKNQVSVNTLGSDYWKRIVDFPNHFFIFGLGIFVGGTVNWLARDWARDDSILNSHEQFILSLDLKKESYEKVPQPDLEKDSWGPDLWTLGVVRDCLSIFASKFYFLDVWIMKEYGHKESWTKLYSVPKLQARDFVACKALYISEDGQLLVDFYEKGSGKMKLVVYDSKSGTSAIAEFQNNYSVLNPKVYIESLMSL